ncbi:response regulator [Algicola sagamiensis]|uniref:response regulator n=1 Tax=Algicola sagamiensis TaxID=163869 RepID=UPI0003721DED|nr:response regulator [Algicola sagamiensis]
MSNDFLFDDEQHEEDHEGVTAWKILIVDDEPEVHAVTRLALSDFTFQDKPLEFISAHSGKEAKELILQHPEAAIVLLDVVMETDDAGLQVARYIREEAKNDKVRIILRTGQPGQAPERQVIVNYDINDYKSKTELTAQKLFTVVMASLRSYRDILSLDQSKQGLEKIIMASANLFSAHSMDQFINGVMQQLVSVIGSVDEALYATSQLVAQIEGQPMDLSGLKVLAGQGEFQGSEGQAVNTVLKGDLVSAFQEALSRKNIVYRGNYLVAYCSSRFTQGSLLYVSGIPHLMSDTDKSLIELFAQNVQVAYENVQLQQEIEETHRELVYRLSEAVEAGDIEKGNHVKRVAMISQLIAQKSGLSEEEAEIIMLASPLHDVGKLSIPDSILQNPNKLEGEDWEVMKSHAEKGYQILKNSSHEIIQAGAVIAKEHHEWWDGSGYPEGKSGDAIHLYGRIVALADVYDSLRHERCYKQPWDKNATVQWIKEHSGKQFDPKLVQLLEDNLEEIERILTEYPDDS